MSHSHCSSDAVKVHCSIFWGFLMYDLKLLPLHSHHQGDHCVLHLPQPVIHNRWLTLCMSVPAPGEALAVQTHVPHFSWNVTGRDSYNPHTPAKRRYQNTKNSTRYSMWYDWCFSFLFRLSLFHFKFLISCSFCHRASIDQSNQHMHYGGIQTKTSQLHYMKGW